MAVTPKVIPRWLRQLILSFCTQEGEDQRALKQQVELLICIAFSIRFQRAAAAQVGRGAWML